MFVIFELANEAKILVFKVVNFFHFLDFHGNQTESNEYYNKEEKKETDKQIRRSPTAKWSC
jgi:hypothetical protein